MGSADNGLGRTSDYSTHRAQKPAVVSDRNTMPQRGFSPPYLTLQSPVRTASVSDPEAIEPGIRHIQDTADKDGLAVGETGPCLAGAVDGRFALQQMSPPVHRESRADR